jgi:hypothetical protein
MLAVMVVLEQHQVLVAHLSLMQVVAVLAHTHPEH